MPIGGIDPNGLPTRRDGAHVRDEPLGAVEAQDGDRLVGLESRGQQPTGKGNDLFVVLGPGPCAPLTIPLDLKRKLVR